MRRYSQVFLKNKNIAKKIVEAFSNINPSQKICEIGPGKVILTEILYSYFGKDITVIDIDQLMIEQIKLRFPEINAMHYDFLKINLDELDISYFIGNLPYHISTAIIEKLIKYKNFKGGVFMLQKEVAKKLVSTPKTPGYGYLSAAVNISCQTEYLFEVGKENFFPVPKVDSAVVSIKKTKTIPPYDFEKYIKFIGYAFRHKRKTLLNSLILSTDLGKECLIKILEKNSISINTRAEELSPSKLFELSKMVEI